MINFARYEYMRDRSDGPITVNASFAEDMFDDIAMPLGN
jgi:hypothetical protein